MKKLLSTLLTLFSFSSFAQLPDLVAFVNDEPITKYDLESRKNMLVKLNNIDISNPIINKKINKDVLNVLIEEKILSQHLSKVEIKIDQTEIDAAFSAIEKEHNMPKGGLSKYLRKKNISVEAFKNQLRVDISKNHIIRSISQQISVSPNELDIALVHNNNNFAVEAWVFKSKKSNEKAKEQMHLLKKRLTNCRQVSDKLFADFADGEKFDRQISKVPENTQSVILDTKVGTSSSVYKQDNHYKMVFVCKKEASASEKDLNQIKAFLSNQKMSKQALKFFKDLKNQSTIKIMIP